MKFDKPEDYMETIIRLIIGGISLAMVAAALYLIPIKQDQNAPYPQRFIIMAPQQNQPDQPLASAIEQGLRLPDKPKISFFRTIPFATLLMFLAVMTAGLLRTKTAAPLLICAAIVTAILLPASYWAYRQTIQKYDLPSKEVLIETRTKLFVVPISDVTMLSDGQINVRTQAGNLKTPFTKITLNEDASE